MTLLELIFISIGLSMDSFAISICKGLNINKLKISYTLLLTFFLSFFQASMPIIGWILSIKFQKYIINIDHWIAFILLSYIGISMIKDSFKKDSKQIKNINNNYYSFKEIILLSIATSIDALSMGIAFVSFNINIFFSSIIIFITTFLFSTLGINISYLLKQKLKYLNNISTILGGIILISIGIKILIKHLFI